MKHSWGLRWWELLPEAVLGLGLGVFLLTETSAATSAFKSSTAIVLMVVAAVGWFATRVLLVRYTRWPALRLLVFAGAALGVLSVVVLPAYDDTTVIETLEVSVGATVAPQSEATTTSTATAPTKAAPRTTPPTAPRTAIAATPPPTTAPSTSILATPALTTPPTAPPTAIPATPVALRASPIHGIDHRARGTAVLYRQPDGSQVIGLEDIDIQPGPDYDVYVVPGADRENLDGGKRLDDLRGNKGTQYYPVPPSIDVTKGKWTVLVWCQTFDVPVAGATPV